MCIRKNRTMSTRYARGTMMNCQKGKKSSMKRTIVKLVKLAHLEQLERKKMKKLRERAENLKI